VVQAATDVTGFGLAGHLLSLLRGTRLSARLTRDAIPLLPGAELLWRDGLRSTAHPANRAAFGARITGASELDRAWLFDPQTAGGGLLLVSPDRWAACDEAFEAAGEPRPARIGRLIAEPDAESDGEPRIEVDAATLPRP
jgi:selenide,water dikinase